MRDEYKGDHVAITDVECVKSSPKAVLVVIDGEEHWIPQSQVHEDSEVYGRGHKGKLIITKWIAGERGLWEKEE